MCVGDGNCQCIGSIRAGNFHAGKQARDHCMHLRLLRATRADHRLLDQPRGIFTDLDAGTRRAHQHDATRLAEFERRLRVLVDEHFFDRARSRLVIGEQRFKLVGERGKSARQRRLRVRLDLSVRNMGEAVPVSLNQSPTGGAESGVEAENSQASFSSSSSGTS